MGQRVEDPSTRPGYAIGIDLGGTKIRAMLATADRRVVAETLQPTDPRGGHAVVGQLTEITTGLLAGAGVRPEELLGTGLGSPGVVDPVSGELALSPNIRGLDLIDFRGELAALPGARVVVENDVNAAALGELAFGGHGRRDFVFVALGTGIGMGIVSAGRLIHGAHGAAGEIGFIPLRTDPFDPANQVRGPLEEALAGDRLARSYRELTGRTITPAEIFDLAAAGEAEATAVVEEYAVGLALGLRAVCAVLDPGAVILGGGVGSRPELLGPVRSCLGRLTATPPTVEVSTLGARAAVLGALTLVTADPVPASGEVGP